MIIGFPPCTYTTNAGAKHLHRGHKLNIPRYYKGMCGKALFEAIRHAECERIAVENPIPSNIVEPQANCHEAGTWFMKGGKERQRNRSKLCHGFAVAMAEQWAGVANEAEN